MVSHQKRKIRDLHLSSIALDLKAIAIQVIMSLFVHSSSDKRYQIDSVTACLSQTLFALPFATSSDSKASIQACVGLHLRLKCEKEIFVQCVCAFVLKEIQRNSICNTLVILIVRNSMVSKMHSCFDVVLSHLINALLI